ncbi:MAG TPA: type II toxin-antitoxin system prevent-host-death family antitoxin [Candidatus Acidoferrum sp.]
MRRKLDCGEARARFGELIDKAWTCGPQWITADGGEAVVVVSASEWRRKVRRDGNLVEFLERSPLRGSGLLVRRLKDGPRE